MTLMVHVKITRRLLDVQCGRGGRVIMIRLGREVRK